MKQLIERIMRSWPVRAWQRFGDMRGPVLAQGMTLQAFLSLFAALFVAFAVFSSVLSGNPELRSAVIDSISASIPGLFGEGGAVDVELLLSTRIAGWAGAIGAVAILFTAIAWIAVSREGFRAMFDLGSPPSNFVLLKLGDLGVAVGIGLLVVVSAGVLIVTEGFAEALGLGWATWLLAIAVQLVLDTTIVLLLYRFGGRLRLPAKVIVPAAIACAIAFFGLKQVASMLFGAVDNNPLLGGVAAPVIILIWFGFIMQILLLALAFVAVTPVGRAYTRLVEAGGIDATLTPAQAKALLTEIEEGRRPSLNAVRAHKRLAKRLR
ncbi:YihY/virulence factor BrkB family protein [Agrococcus sp. ARC_14]|uniref:YihY/virulence factor BrkB family protein n=1 Tax=Agrococcus sp. ARC_14 TaxID=2919927 RepID=UPI001F05807D|nr:YihY/virulence factor BrkB family protein [Agrococcus sp. ARC_14]MCH1882269.1 YihY/virulence factor BrkB family protein [Agrococcus sp. ARC_14]